MAVKLNPNDYEFADEQPQQEGWGGYALRNTAKIPALTYSAVRSGFGLGDLAQYVRNEEDPYNSVKDKILRAALPTYEQARGEASAILPSYFTEYKQGDTIPEFIGELIGTAPIAGVKTLGQAVKYGARALGGLAGAHLGGAAGEILGGETGKVLGGLAGGVIGAHKAPFQGKKGSIRPTNVLQKAEKSSFESNKLQKINAVKSKYDPKIADFEKKSRELLLKYPQEKNKFQEIKSKEISRIQHDINNYDNNIKSIELKRHPYYKEASKLSKGIKAPAHNIQNIIESINTESNKGLPLSDKSAILNNLIAVESNVHKGMLSLDDAKALKQNFNSQIYKKSASPAFKKSMAPLVEYLNDFIVNEGGMEHLEPWLKAEDATKKLHELKRFRKDFVQQKQNDIKNIASRTFDSERKALLQQSSKELKSSLKELHNQRNKELSGIQRETYDKYLKSQDNRGRIEKVFDKLIGDKENKGAIGLMLAAVAYTMGGWKASAIPSSILYALNTAGKETKSAIKLFMDHPEYYKKVVDLLKYNTPKDYHILRKALHTLDDELASKLSQKKSSTLNPDDYEFA